MPAVSVCGHDQDTKRGRRDRGAGRPRGRFRRPPRGRQGGDLASRGRGQRLRRHRRRGVRQLRRRTRAVRYRRLCQALRIRSGKPQPGVGRRLPAGPRQSPGGHVRDRRIAAAEVLRNALDQGNEGREGPPGGRRPGRSVRTLGGAFALGTPRLGERPRAGGRAGRARPRRGVEPAAPRLRGPRAAPPLSAAPRAPVPRGRTSPDRRPVRRRHGSRPLGTRADPLPDRA